MVLALRSELRNRWREWLVLALALGLFAGAVTTVVAGARRTDTAYQRFLEATRAPDLLVFGGPASASTFAQFSPQRLASLGQVTAAGRVLAFEVTQPADIELLAPTSGAVGGSFWTKKLLSGRFADPNRADEVTISFALAQADHVVVGDRLEIRVEPAATTGHVDTVSFRVVGIDAAASEFPPAYGTGINAAWATPAFARAYGRSLGTDVVMALRFRGGAADAHPVIAELSKLSGGRPIQAFALGDQSINTQRSIHLQAVALWILAGLLALIALLVMGQFFARQSWLELDTFRRLHALGMTGRELWGVGMLRVTLIGVVAAGAAVGIAVAASPLLPVGLAGVAEPDPGFAVDAVAVVIGTLGIVCLLLLCCALPSWWAASNAARPGTRSPAERRPSRVVFALCRWNAPAPATTGVAWAVQPGNERTAVPVRTTIAIAIVGVTALTAAFAFSTSLGHLLGTPSLYGVSWDAEVTSSLGEGVDMGGAMPALRADSEITAIAEGYAGVPVQVGAVRVDGLALDRVSGSSLMPRLVQGRLPTRPNEVMVGSSTLATLHAHIGSTLRVTFAGVPARQPVRVVGRGVFPTLSDQLGLGRGMSFTTSTLKASIPAGQTPPPDTILVRFRSGADKPAAIAHLSASLAGRGPYDAIPPDQPVDLVNFGRVSALPVIFGALLTLLAVAALANLLVTAIRRRRGDLAILRVIGFVPRQLRSAVSWQATTIALIALLVGLPLGIVAGRLLWNVFADQIGVVAVPVIPWTTLVIEIGATLLLANLIALVTARRVARTHPAEALRTP